MEENLHQKKLQGFAKFIETQRKLKRTSRLIIHPFYIILSSINQIFLMAHKIFVY